MDKKLELYRKVIEEERQYSEDISPILKELSRNVADLLEIAAQQGVEGTERKRLLDEDYAKISALTKSLHAKVKSVIVGQKSASEPPNEGIQGPTTPENAQKELIEVRKQMESSNKSFISMGCCITELLSVLTQEDSNTSRLIEGFEAQIRVYFKFVERTLISYFNSVHERENMRADAGS
ncbi:uncharacterized protein LOC132258518 [Phlebotomus argentipes]|uniref:uncharacterized protein LOC132258518 n=1 Tax=Phlebotomus argentipes TaxID=94469 RepID=UPI002892E4AF|nr:uncharacterized protein LOC132258518 [Phlebotomus argentipes]